MTHSKNRITARGLRLSTMMFLQYFIWGAWFVTAYPVLSSYGFGADEIKWTYSAGPIAAMISPLIMGFIADRWIALQKLNALLHLLGGAALLLAVVGLQQEDVSSAWVNRSILFHMLCYMPTISLTNAIALRHLGDAQQDFPRIRFFGGLGWIAAGGLISLLNFDRSLASFYLAITASGLMAIYSLSLPNSPPIPGQASNLRSIFGLNTWFMLRDRSYAIFIAAMFLLFIPIAFYFQLGAKFVGESGFQKVAATLSIGQVSELIFMLILPFALRKYGMKTILIVGCSAWLLRYALFASAFHWELLWLLVAGIALHGLSYDFCFVAGTIHVGETAPREIQAQAQGFFMMVTYGLGMFIGAQLAGAVEASAIAAQSASESSSTNWAYIWLIPAGIAALVLLLLVIFFRKPRQQVEANDLNFSNMEQTKGVIPHEQ